MHCSSVLLYDNGELENFYTIMVNWRISLVNKTQPKMF